nr:addiction module antidote protein [Rubrivivax gelatinosus]
MVDFGATRYLDNDEAIAEYLSTALEANDADFLQLALGDAVRAKGMKQVARDAGLSPEGLHKTLAPGAQPGFETVVKLCAPWGCS